ncbi:MAG: SDR family oxidoreductase [Betaproteobacteria bacterium]|jgi:NAD(P)-dependent dehydrogenase (short-subunit alcohol dehydrogenase family)|nr:SDR family oxidoreductase [Betaproteobacteria bacterium]
MSESISDCQLSIIVTGGASGIGAAVAELVLERGGYVGILDIDFTKCSTNLSSRKGRCAHVVASTLDQAAVSDAWSQMANALDRPINGLVNCAGVPPIPAPIETYEVSEWSRLLESHLTGTYIPCKVIGSELARLGRGAIVNLASVLAFRSGPVLAYGAAKSGVVSLTESLAVHWAKSGVRVNAVAPGWTETPFLRPPGRADRDLSPIIDATPQKRLLSPREIAEVIYFLLSDSSRAITGVTIPCDGGVIAGSGWAPYGGFDIFPSSSA